MKRTGLMIGVASALGIASLCAATGGPRQMENLGRGVVAINPGEGNVFVSWRLLGTEPDDTAFNLYRATGGDQPVRLNAQPMAKATCCQDSDVDLSRDHSYFVRPVIRGLEGEMSKPFLNKMTANSAPRPYLEVPLKLPPGTSAGDGSLGDLDGDGIAEIAVRTADGSVDGTGKVIGDSKADWVDRVPHSRTFAKIMIGPEYFSIFSGRSSRLPAMCSPSMRT